MIELPTSTRWHDNNAMIRDFDNLEQNLRDLRTALACICMQQDDKTFSVPFSELVKVPKDAELEVAVDRTHGNYVFRLLDKNGNPLGLNIFADQPAVPEGTGLPGDDHVPGGLG